jgi:hypothetical protein
LACSFCGKDEADVEKLVAGPKVYICDECVAIARGFVIRSEANRYDTVNQIVYSQHRYEEYGADGILVRTSLNRLDLAYLYPADIRRLFTQAGFGAVTIRGGFDGRPVLRDTDELVVEATVEA